MAQIIEIKAPATFKEHKNNVWIFLAGGIQKCHDWQKDVVSVLNASEETLSKDLILFNPRQESFNNDDPEAGIKQINWEFDYLNKMDMFTMFFYGPTESDQPICFYELGRYIEVIKNKFPKDWQDRIIISTSSKFKRSFDVMAQSSLATNHQIKINIQDDYNALVERHVRMILTLVKHI